MSDNPKNSRTLRGIVALSLFTVVCLATAYLSSRPVPREVGGKGPEMGEQAPARDVAVLPAPPLSETEYLNTGSEAQYVGKQVCAECHQQIFDSFESTRHNHSMSLISEQKEMLPDSTVVHGESGYQYTTTSSQDSLTHTEKVLLGGDAREVRQAQVTHVVGSGEFGHSYLMNLDGFLVQSPLTWYSTRSEWDLSPGFESSQQLSFRRAISARCLYCHGGIVDVQNENEFDVSIREIAISCERCHGPGSLHVEKQRKAGSSSAGGDLTIVNPARLSRELNESVCQQCHLQGDMQVTVRGRRFDSFRPGLPLDQFRQDYRLKQKSAMTIVGHGEQMHLSKCYTESNTLTCTSCHDPHHRVPGEKRVDYYRTACLKCHTRDSCGETLEKRIAAEGDSCIKCHMPASPTEIPHVAFTHHRIGLHDEAAETVAEVDSGEQSGELIPMLRDDHLPAEDRDRCRGLAWLNLYLTRPELTQSDLKTSQELLERAWNAGCQDAAVAAGLAQIAQEIGWLEGAEMWATRALDMEPLPADSRMSALQTRSEVLFHQQRFQEALPGFLELTRFRRDARHWFFKGMVEQNLDQTEQAIESLKKSIEINPRNQGAYSLLAAIYESRGETEQRDRYIELANELLE